MLTYTCAHTQLAGTSTMAIENNTAEYTDTQGHPTRMSLLTIPSKNIEQIIYSCTFTFMNLTV
jgi:hypothetical protein